MQRWQQLFAENHNTTQMYPWNGHLIDGLNKLHDERIVSVIHVVFSVVAVASTEADDVVVICDCCSCCCCCCACHRAATEQSIQKER